MNICRYFTTLLEDVSALHYATDNTPEKRDWRINAFYSKIGGLIMQIMALFLKTIGILCISHAIRTPLATVSLSAAIGGHFILLAGICYFIIGHDVIIQGMNMSDYLRQNNEITISRNSNLMLQGSWIAFT